MATVLVVLCNAIRDLSVAIMPVIPAGAAQILDYLAIPAEGRTYQAIATRQLQSGFKIAQPAPVFPRLEAPQDVAA
jgi:methionyl-tRNA synthetase